MVGRHSQLSPPRPSAASVAGWQSQNLPTSRAWHRGWGEGTGQDPLLHKQCRYNPSCGKVQRASQGMKLKRDFSGKNENQAIKQTIQLPITVYIIYNIELIR